MTIEVSADSAKWMALSKYEAEEMFNALPGDEKDVLLQLRQVRWDGFIASKHGRDCLIDKGLATRYEGFTTLTPRGLILLCQAGRLHSLECSGKLTPDGKC